MSAEFSVTQILANLEAQMEFHREKEEHHAKEEAFHREQRTLHAAEYETVAKHYEAFKASAGGAAEIAARKVIPAPAPAREEGPLPPLKLVMGSRLVARLVQELPSGEAFTPTQVAGEVNRRYPRELRRPISSRLASTALRRLLANGVVQMVRKGTAHREAVYTRR